MPVFQLLLLLYVYVAVHVCLLHLRQMSLVTAQRQSQVVGGQHHIQEGVRQLQPELPVMWCLSLSAAGLNALLGVEVIWVEVKWCGQVACLQVGFVKLPVKQAGRKMAYLHGPAVLPAGLSALQQCRASAVQGLCCSFMQRAAMVVVLTSVLFCCVCLLLPGRP